MSLMDKGASRDNIDRQKQILENEAKQSVGSLIQRIVSHNLKKGKPTLTSPSTIITTPFKSRVPKNDTKDPRDPKILAGQAVNLLGLGIDVIHGRMLTQEQAKTLYKINAIEKFDKETNLAQYNPAVLGGLVKTMMNHAGYDCGLQVKPNLKKWEIKEPFKNFKRGMAAELLQRIYSKYTENARKIKLGLVTDLKVYASCPLNVNDVIIHSGELHTVIETRKDEVVLVNTIADVDSKSRDSLSKSVVVVDSLLYENPWIDVNGYLSDKQPLRCE